MKQRFTLLISKNGVPIDVIDYEDCFRLLAKGNAIAIDTLPAVGQDYATFNYIHSLDDWFSLPHSDVYIPTCTSTVRVATPEVIMTTEACEHATRKKHIQFNKENLLIRDDYSCGYCGSPLSYSTCTIDHVVPRSKGGKTSWTNCVSSCRKCNFQKKSYDPIGEWKPNHKLIIPNPNSIKYSEVYKKTKNMPWYPRSWDYYLKK